jgi:hypothetical protein
MKLGPMTAAATLLLACTAPLAGRCETPPAIQASAGHFDLARMAAARETVESLQFVPTFKTLFLALVKARADDPRSRRIGESFAQSIEAIAPKLIEQGAQIYAAEFTVAELRAVRDFNRSPAGRSFLAKMPEVMRAASTMADGPAPKADPKAQATALELLELFEFDKMLDKEIAAQPGITPEIAQKVRAMYPEIRTRAAALFASLFTGEELGVAVAFFRTPEGKAFNSKTDELQRRLRPVMLSLLPEMIDAAEAWFCAHGPACTPEDHLYFDGERRSVGAPAKARTSA